MENLRELSPSYKTSLLDPFTERLPHILTEIETEWRRLVTEEKPGPVDSPRESLLRVAHHALAGVLDLEDAGQ